MSQKLDDLFGEGKTVVRPKTRTIVALLGSGLCLALAGLACSSVPGGLLVLLAWSTLEKEIDRVDSGYLPEQALTKLKVLKQLVWGALGLIMLIFVAQTVLLFSGVYVAFWGRLIQSFGGL
jgi:hypothetical protein